MTSKSSSNSSIADTLRSMAKSYAWKDDGDYTQEIAACFAGAAAWEIVRELANVSNPELLNSRIQIHKLREQARTLVKGTK